MAPERQRRTDRVRKDIFADYNDDELLKRFRLDRAGIAAVTDLVREELQSQRNGNRPLSYETMVAITLQYLATGKMQQCNYDVFGTTQPSISRVISQTLDALHNSLVVTDMIFPFAQSDVLQKQVEFMQATQFPGVVGVTDCTHIRIVAPNGDGDEELYMNKQHYHSINVQLVFDANYRILDVDAYHPGSVSDAEVMDHSVVKMRFEDGLMPAGCYILGDSDYPCKQWLLTPYHNPQTVAQTNYNRAHRKAYSTVERGIDQLKRRFPILNTKVQLNPRKTNLLVKVCALLHNICKARGIPLPDDDVDAVEVGDADGSEQLHPFRDYIANLYFNDA